MVQPAISRAIKNFSVPVIAFGFFSEVVNFLNSCLHGVCFIAFV